MTKDADGYEPRGSSEMTGTAAPVDGEGKQAPAPFSVSPAHHAVD